NCRERSSGRTTGPKGRSSRPRPCFRGRAACRSTRRSSCAKATDGDRRAAGARVEHVEYGQPRTMHADLERVITLQRLDSAAHDGQRRLAEEPERQKAIDARLDAARQKVAATKARLADSQNARRALEKDVAVHQGRLSKFRDQLMAVKTNQEYQAMQKEIEFAQSEVKLIEDKVLERMLEADD